MSWHRGPLALFDVESSGLDPHRDRIVTAAIVEVTPGQAADDDADALWTQGGPA